VANSWCDVIPGWCQGVDSVSLGDWTGVNRFADVAVECQHVADGIGLVDRSYRGLLEITGADRSSWLHHFVTNQVTALRSGDGNYAFATNAKGRILFDLYVLIKPDSIWLDIDRRWTIAALNHFNKYIITEDVHLTDRSDDFLRIAMIGHACNVPLAKSGATHAAAAPLLQNGEIVLADVTTPFHRSDFCGLFSLDLFVSPDAAQTVWNQLRAFDNAKPVGFAMTDTLRIEAAIPWPISEINDDMLPAETGQFGRAVSYQKGCYLGQEIIERMRSRDSVSRKLVQLQFDSTADPTSDVELFDAHKPIGRVTSARFSPNQARSVALGYVRAEAAISGKRLHAQFKSGMIDVVVTATAADLADTH